MDLGEVPRRWEGRARGESEEPSDPDGSFEAPSTASEGGGIDVDETPRMPSGFQR